MAFYGGRLQSQHLPLSLLTVMMDSGFALAAPLASPAAFGFSCYVEISRISTVGNPICAFTGDRKHVLVIKGNVTIMVGQEFTRKRPSPVDWGRMT